MSEEPALRVRNAKALWRFLETYEEGLQERVRGIAPEGLIEEIESAPRAGWLSLEKDRRFVLAIIEAIGSEEAAIAMWRKFAVIWKEEPLIRPIFDACVRVFGLDVMAFSRIVSRFYATEYRGMGVMEAIRQDDDSMVVMINDMPPAMFEGKAYQVVFLGMFEGMCDVALSPAPRVSAVPDAEQGFMQIILEGVRDTRLRLPNVIAEA